MRIILDFDTEVSIPFTEDFFLLIAENTLMAYTSSLPQEREIHMSVTCVLKEKIFELNKKYRGIEKVTDVLSFGEYTHPVDFVKETMSSIFLGEIFLCPEFIKKASLEDCVTFAREMTYVFSHGILHLIGFDHEEEMFLLQEKVTDALTGKKEYSEDSI